MASESNVDRGYTSDPEIYQQQDIGSSALLSSSAISEQALNVIIKI